MNQQIDNATTLPLGRFMRLLAHELGNPVATIRMSAEMVLDEAIHLEALVERALFYASLGAPTPVQVDVEQLVESISRVHADEVSIELDDRTRGDTVGVDPGQFSRLLTEALENAADSGATKLQIRAERQEGQLHLTLTDNGAGIEADPAERVFEPFYTTREGKLGLGSTIAHRIAELHGGT